MGIMQAREVRSDWRNSALKAVELDDLSSEAHAVLAAFLTWSEWDWERAWPEWRRAIELNPNNAGALIYYSHFLAIIGHIDEAPLPMEKALDIDPFNPLNHSMYAALLNYHCRYNEVIEVAHRALSLQPDAPIAFSNLGMALEAMGRKEEHIALVRQRIANDTERLAAFEQGLATGGYERAFRNDADILAARYEQGTKRSGAVGIAGLYRTAGEVKRAVDWLETAYLDRDGNLAIYWRTH